MVHIKSSQRDTRAAGSFALFAAAALALSACAASEPDTTATTDTGAATTTEASDSTGETLRIAVLMSSSQNGYNAAVLEGAEAAASEIGNVEVSGFDGQFDSNTQFSQVQNVATQDQYDGIIVVPNDGVSLAGAFPLASDLPVISILNPIGVDIHDMEPQVEGVVQTIAQDPAVGATTAAEAVADYCADLDPCNVIIVSGQFNTTLDVTRVEAFNEVFSQHDNIEVVSTLEGKWDRDASLTAVSNALQAHPDVNAIISQGDQMIFGAEIALENANIDPADVFLVGGGGTKEAISKVRSGAWGMTYQSFPLTAGTVALENIVAYLQGEEIETWVNQDLLVPGNDAFATAETLSNLPDFDGEWDG